jgi:hypothetical protein
MHTQDTAADALAQYFEAGSYGHAPAVGQVIERLPNGEYAWLRADDSNRPNPMMRCTCRHKPAATCAQEALFGRS